MNTEPIDFPMPEWAVARTSHSTTIGAQLRTKDGRKCGNAVTVEFPVESLGLILAKVITDAGTEMLLTENELGELFYQPEFVMDVSTAPGMIVKTAKGGAA